MCQVPVGASSMNHGDVFILDAGKTVYMWSGHVSLQGLAAWLVLLAASMTGSGEFTNRDWNRSLLCFFQEANKFETRAGTRLVGSLSGKRPDCTSVFLKGEEVSSCRTISK